jgi:hypothetical protein
MKKRVFLSISILAALAVNIAYAQSGTQANPVQTAVEFLTIAPDARAGALGDAGVATTPDVNANYWNPAKLAFVDGTTHLSMSYIPWLRQLVSDVKVANMSFMYKLNETNAIGASLRYFNFGSINLYDDAQNQLGIYQPNEYAIDGSYAHRFGNDFSLGLSLRYIHSNLVSGTYSNIQSQAGNSVAADVSFYYKKPVRQFGNDALFSWGIDVSNIGAKISYVSGGPQYFLPTNLRVGVANTWYLDDLNQITAALDLNKLLVPTPPIRDAGGNIIQGRDDNRSVVSGIFGSFTDAPGGFSEEMKEISYSPAVEYWYNKQFALRIGYFYQSPVKGNMQYLTMGTGFKYKSIGVDLAYMVSTQQQSALANTLRLSLGLDLESHKK